MAKQQPIHRLLAGIPNPFLQDRVDSPWQETFQDVPEINRTAFQSCRNSIQAVYQSSQSRGLILHGEPGTGKTHLLQRLRYFTQKEPRTWFIYIPPFSSPGRFWRHLLERFFYDICQRSKEPEVPKGSNLEETFLEEGPGQGPLSQIEEALTRHLMARPLDSTQELAQWWAKICKQDAPGEALFRRLQPTFDRLTVKNKLDPDVMKVIRHYLTWNNRAVAYAYLLGRDLPDEDLATLGVKQSLDDEERAKQAVLTFCRLAGEHFTIILAFDQIEGLQLNPEDFEGLRTYAKFVVDLLSECNNLLILTAMQTYFLSTLDTALRLHASYRDRIAQDESVLTLLTKESARRLVEMRLKTQKEMEDLQRGTKNRSGLWPFRSEEIDKLIPVGGLSARMLIRWARSRFEEIEAPPRPPEDVISNLWDVISSLWSELFEKQLQKPDLRLDEGVYEDGLLRLLQTKSPRGYGVKRGTDKDVQILLEGGKEKIAISVSNSENMTSVARHLGRLQLLASTGKVSRLIFMRDARLPISVTAKIAQERLRELTRRGMQVIRPSAEAYAALNVLRELWNKAAENDLTIGDSAISMGELKKWLTEKTPAPLQELIDACQEIAISSPEALADKLIEILTGQWVISLEEAAQKIALPEKELARLVIEKSEVGGILAGPPPVLFLHPEAISRP